MKFKVLCYTSWEQLFPHERETRIYFADVDIQGLVFNYISLRKRAGQFDSPKAVFFLAFRKSQRNQQVNEKHNL